MDRTLYFCLSSLERGEDIIFLRMWEGALKCLFRFLLRSEVTKGLNFILAASASAMATEGKSNILVLKNIYLTALGLSCPVACRSLVPEPGIKPVSPELEGRFFTPGPPGKSLEYTVIYCGT